MPSSRNFPPVLLGTEYVDGSPPNDIYLAGYAGGSISLGDHGHYGYPRFNLPNVGGNLILDKTTITPGYVGVGEAWRGGATNQRFVGQVCATPKAPSHGYSLVDGSSRGAEAYSKMKPTKPLFQGLNALYELRETPELLRQKFLPTLRHVADWHLAVQFGWLPLLSDVRNMVQTQRRLQKRLNWLLQHNGKPVRRMVELTSFTTAPGVFDLNLLGGNGLSPSLVSQYYTNAGRSREVQTSGERWWASARFRYWLPEGPRDVAWRRKMLIYLNGLYPTPSVIYNAIPWSWLVDWFSNAGNVISNLDAGVASRCAADYVYVMRHNWTQCEYTVNKTMKHRDGTPIPINSTTYYRKDYKTRVAGDPFGFNTAENTLSGMQLSILGALGLSRIR